MVGSVLHAAAVFTGGGAGACCRYAVGRVVARHYARPFPLATWAVNVSGSFLLGFVMGLPHLPGGRPGLLLIEAGFLGGYTTFSTAALETVTLVRARAPGKAAVAWFGGAACGLVAAALGSGAAALLWPGTFTLP